MQIRVGLEVAGAGGQSSHWEQAFELRIWSGRCLQPTRKQKNAAAAALNLRSSRQSDRLLVAGCHRVVGGAHNRCSCGATDMEAGGGDSDVDTAELRGTRTDTEHGGAESSWSHGGTTTWTVTASTDELAATASARTASLYRLRGGHGQTVGFGRDRSREHGVGSGGWRIKVTQRAQRWTFWRAQSEVSRKADRTPGGGRRDPTADGR